ncbi:MAG: PrsW family glutamic-type intramembrane protease [Candidatus Portnoybacteria bacterium]|nr:PrsW family glutamic-type intramembrane protease [Candidatus Portnoybacteria bacterium]MDD4982826.1 PrsW family glutamic-type intramembrane protease [Candidatus Portnoybacteria bacterium]
MNYLLYAILGIAPSIIWLLFYLHKDLNPEPKRTVLLVFLGGAFMGPVAILAQFLAMAALTSSAQWPHFFETLSQNRYLFFINVVLFAPLSEEFLKYLVVKWQVLKNPDFDEPLDAMIYLIISALGFAATENLLNIFLMPGVTLQLAFSQALARFLSATFLHALTSGILGYFIARSLFLFKRKNVIFISGFLLAVALHSFYNYLAWLFNAEKIIALAIALLLAAMGGVVGWQFRRLKKQLAVCKIKY